MIKRLYYYSVAVFFIFGIYHKTKKRTFLAPNIRGKLYFISVSPRLYQTTIRRR